MTDLDKQYDDTMKTTLEDFLKRPAKPNELASADADTDLSVRVMWEIIKSMHDRIEKLEKK